MPAATHCSCFGQTMLTQPPQLQKWAANHCSWRHCGGFTEAACTEQGKHHQTARFSSRATSATHHQGNTPLIQTPGLQFQQD